MVRATAMALALLGPSISLAAEPASGFETPEAAFRAYLSGSTEQDFDRMLAALTRESKAHHVGVAVFSASFLFGNDPDMTKVLAEHLPGEDELKDLPADEEAILVETMSRVKAPARLLAKIAARHEQLARQLNPGATPPDRVAKPDLESVRKLVSQVRLEKLAVKGDTATATAIVPDMLREALTVALGEVSFRRVADRWYCDIDPR